MFNTNRHNAGAIVNDKDASFVHVATWTRGVFSGFVGFDRLSYGLHDDDPWARENPNVKQSLWLVTILLLMIVLSIDPVQSLQYQRTYQQLNNRQVQNNRRGFHHAKQPQGPLQKTTLGSQKPHPNVDEFRLVQVGTVIPIDG